MEKETLDYSFWIGLALAIPLSIVGNILTPKIQNIFARYSKKKSEKRIAQLEASLNEHKELSASAEKIQIFLLEGILLITMLTSVLAAFSGAIFALSYIFAGDNRLVFFRASIFRSWSGYGDKGMFFYISESEKSQEN